MNTLDIVCLVISVIMLLLGLWHGLLRGVFRLLAWILAVAGAYFANKYLFDTVMDFGFSEFSTSIICICVGFIVPFLTLLFVSHMVNKAVADSVVGRVDRIFGAFFGLLKAGVILFVILTILHILPFGDVLKETRNESVAYSLYKSALEVMGYSSEPVDLVNVAERKASELTEGLVNKASEKAGEVAEKAADVAKDAVQKAADAAADAAQNAAQEAAQKAIDDIADKATANINIKTKVTTEVAPKAEAKADAPKAEVPAAE